MTKRALPRFASALCFAAALCLATPPAFADGDYNFFIGQKTLDEDDWGSANENDEVGMEMSWGERRSPVRLATDVFFSHGDATAPSFDYDMFTWELAVGVRGVWKAGLARPFIGGGLAVVGVREEFDFPGLSSSEDDQVIGTWVGGGVFWRAGRNFNIGFSGRITSAEVELSGFDLEAGGFHFGLLLGWGS